MKKITALLICFNIAFTPMYAYIINDDFIDSTLDKNMKIKKYQYHPIVDEFAMQNKNLNSSKKDIVIDEIKPDMPKKKFVKRPIIFDENYKEIKIKIKDYYTTKSNINEGDYIDFITIDDIKIKNKLYPKGTIVKAQLETISKNKSFGVPSDLVVGNFTIDDNPLIGEISKTGANRSLWVYPTACATSFFFGLGLFLLPIRGGHAKIKPSEQFRLYIIE